MEEQGDVKYMAVDRIAGQGLGLEDLKKFGMTAEEMKQYKQSGRTQGIPSVSVEEWQDVILSKNEPNTELLRVTQNGMETVGLPEAEKLGLKEIQIQATVYADKTYDTINGPWKMLNELFNPNVQWNPDCRLFLAKCSATPKVMGQGDLETAWTNFAVQASREITTLLDLARNLEERNNYAHKPVDTLRRILDENGENESWLDSHEISQDNIDSILDTLTSIAQVINDGTGIMGAFDKLTSQRKDLNELSVSIAGNKVHMAATNVQLEKILSWQAEYEKNAKLLSAEFDKDQQAVEDFMQYNRDAHAAILAELIDMKRSLANTSNISRIEPEPMSEIQFLMRDLSLMVQNGYMTDADRIGTLRQFIENQTSFHAMDPAPKLTAKSRDEKYDFSTTLKEGDGPKLTGTLSNSDLLTINSIVGDKEIKPPTRGVGSSCKINTNVTPNLTPVPPGIYLQTPSPDTEKRHFVRRVIQKRLDPWDATFVQYRAFIDENQEFTPWTPLTDHSRFYNCLEVADDTPLDEVIRLQKNLDKP